MTGPAAEARGRRRARREDLERRVAVLVEVTDADREWFCGLDEGARHQVLDGLRTLARGDVAEALAACHRERVEAEQATARTNGAPSVGEAAATSAMMDLAGRVELALILDEVDHLLGRFVAFPSDEARWAVALWVAHTWTLAAHESTPRLALLSPEKGSGKTRTLEVLELVVPGALHTVNVSAAALFRKVAEGRCTLLLDEADTYLGLGTAQQHEDLRGLVNAGHRRGAVAYRCVVDKGVKVEEFPAFAPAALAGIGDLPDTILDRSIVVAMKRRAPGEHVDPFRRRKAKPAADAIAERLAEWADLHLDAIEDADPEMPDGLVDRAADVWEALIVLGDHAGAHWRGRSRTAAKALNDLRADRDPSLGVRLLEDCRAIFGDADRMMTEQLVEGLVKLDESPWGDLRGKELDARGLARRLRKYDVRPGQVRFSETVTRKGYLRAGFEDAWQRYLPPPGVPKQPEQPKQNGATDPEPVSDVSPVSHPQGGDEGARPLFDEDEYASSDAVEFDIEAGAE